MILSANLAFAYKIKCTGICKETNESVEALVEINTKYMYDTNTIHKPIVGIIVSKYNSIPIVGIIKDHYKIIANGRGYNFELDNPFN